MTADPGAPDLKSRARDLADDARDFAGNHRFGVGAGVALLLAAVVAWIFREPLAAIVRDVLADEAEEDSEPVDDVGRSQENTPDSAET